MAGQKKNSSNEPTADEGDDDSGSDSGSSLGLRRELQPVQADGVIWPTWVDLDRAIAIGGMDEEQRPKRSTEVFDILRNCWEKGPDMLKKRWGCAAVWIDDEKLLVIGGFNGHAYLDTTEILDTTKMTFTEGPKMYYKRAGCTAARMSKRHIMVIGGYGLDTTEVLLLPRSQEEIEEEAAAAKGKGKGKEGKEKAGKGKDASGKGKSKGKDGKGKGKGKFGNTLSLDKQQGERTASKSSRQGSKRRTSKSSRGSSKELAERMKFLPGPRLRSVRAGCSAVILDDRRLLVMGGFDQLGCVDTTELFDLDIAQRNFDILMAMTTPTLEPQHDLDLTAGRFTQGPDLLGRRAACTGVRIDEARVLLIGGFDGQIRLNTTEVLDIDKMEFKPGPVLLEPRSGCAALLVKEDKLLVVGGCDLSTGGGRCQNTTEVLTFVSEVALGDFVEGPEMAIERGYLAVTPWVSPAPPDRDDADEPLTDEEP